MLGLVLGLAPGLVLVLGGLGSRGLRSKGLGSEVLGLGLERV